MNLGFSTARGKSVVSSDTLAKGQAFFKDLEHEDFSLADLEKFKGIRPAENGDDNYNCAAMGFQPVMITTPLAIKTPDPQAGFEKIAINLGFSNARGKSVISSDTLAKGQAFFKDLENEDFSLTDLEKLEGSRPAENGIDNYNCAAIGFQPVMITPSAIKTPDPQAVCKKIEHVDATPKLPAYAKLPLGRRRLADASPASTSLAKKRRFTIFSRMDATDEVTTSKPKSVLALSAPALLSQLPMRRPSFHYGSQNGQRTMLDAVKTPDFSALTPSQNAMDGLYDVIGPGMSNGSGEARKIRLGKLYRQRKGPRTNLSSALAGQTPRIYDLEYYERYGVRKTTLEVNCQNSHTFGFTKDYFGLGPGDSMDETRFPVGDGVVVECDETGSISSEDFIKAFMSSSIVDSKLISEAWCLNHYRWIVWKEAAMEAGFPHLFGGKLLTPDRVMLQLKYRYDREIEKSERSCLKRILNGDDSTYRPMVLCVSAVVMDKDVDAQIEVTDGWYSIKARLDMPLSRLLVSAKIFVGQKLFISRCSITGVESGFEPLEVPANVQLVLSANCVRRARWNAILGFQRLRGAVQFSLSSLAVGGGTVASVEIVVQRILPRMYMVKSSNGNTLVMDEKAEERDARKFQDHYDRCLEQLMKEVEKTLLPEIEASETGGELESEADAESSDLIPRTQEIQAVCDIEKLYRLITRSADPAAVADAATLTQKERLKTFCAKMNEQQALRFHDKLEKAVREKAFQLPQRKVTPFLKMRVAGCHQKDMTREVTPLLTIWRPDDDALYHVKEGMRYVVTHIQVTQSNAASDCCNFALSTTAETRFIPVQTKKYPAATNE